MNASTAPRATPKVCFLRRHPFCCPWTLSLVGFNSPEREQGNPCFFNSFGGLFFPTRDLVTTHTRKLAYTRHRNERRDALWGIETRSEESEAHEANAIIERASGADPGRWKGRPPAGSSRRGREPVQERSDERASGEQRQGELQLGHDVVALQESPGPVHLVPHAERPCRAVAVEAVDAIDAVDAVDAVRGSRR